MIHFVVGGARSGKSRYAENLASKIATESTRQTGNHSDESAQRCVIYVATAVAGDKEMRARIDHHQQSRSDQWMLVEEPFYLSAVIENYANKGWVLIIECMTLWLSNWLCSQDSENWEIEKATFIDQLLNCNADVIIVSNEVGSGVVPIGELSREFVDQAGWLNQALAQIADEATLVVAGCPVTLREPQ